MKKIIRRIPMILEVPATILSASWATKSEWYIMAFIFALAGFLVSVMKFRENRDNQRR